MALTVEQTAEISSQLSVDLSTVTDDRLIELCLLYRSAPIALPSFPVLLETEIIRRFTATEIAANNVMFSVIQNFLNTFYGLSGYQSKLYELTSTEPSLRDDWFRDNATFFYNVLRNAEALTWLIGNVELMSYVVASGVAMTAVTLSNAAMTAISASSQLMVNIVASNVAMTAIVTSSMSLSKIAVSTPARNALMSNNTVFQSFKVQIYNTVKIAWVKQSGISQAENPNQDFLSINGAVASPQGFVFASLGWNLTFTAGTVTAKHPNGAIANTAGTSSAPTTLDKLDAISFNGATLRGGAGNYPAAYAELWSPPA